MLKFYGRRGSVTDIYFGNCPFVRISFLRFLFELLVMWNPLVYTERGLKKYQSKLDVGNYKLRREKAMIDWALDDKSLNESWYENQENIFIQKEVNTKLLLKESSNGNQQELL